jgi:hypothetical protein
MSEEYGRILSVECPVHPGNSRIRRVSVVYADEAPRLLSPGPVLKAADRLAWAGTLVGVAGMAAIVIGNMVGRGATGPALVVGCICFAYALALYGWAGARRARLTIVQRGMPGAMALWQAAWYCDECDGVFFEPAALRQAAGGDVAPGQVISPAAFHRLVWKTGRYGGVLGRAVG